MNIRGDHDLLRACSDCYASLFTDRAIIYRNEKGFKHTEVALSIGIQQMVRSDRGSSGVIFTIDTETGKVLIMYNKTLLNHEECGILSKLYSSFRLP